MRRDQAPKALCVWDTETDGVDITQNRILTAYAMVQDISGNKLREASWTLNHDVPIPPGASEVNGLTREYLREHGRADVEAATVEIREFLYAASDQGLPIVAYNGAFDLATLDYSLDSIGEPRLDFGEAQFFDPFVYDVGTVIKRRGNRKLMTVAGRHYGIPIDESRLHEAQYDVEVAAKLAWLMLQRSPYDMVELQSLQPKWRKAYADNLTSYFASIGKTEEDGSPIVVDDSFPWNRGEK